MVQQTANSKENLRQRMEIIERKVNNKDRGEVRERKLA